MTNILKSDGNEITNKTSVKALHIQTEMERNKIGINNIQRIKNNRPCIQHISPLFKLTLTSRANITGQVQKTPVVGSQRRDLEFTGRVGVLAGGNSYTMCRQKRSKIPSCRKLK